MTPTITRPTSKMDKDNVDKVDNVDKELWRGWKCELDGQRHCGQSGQGA